MALRSREGGCGRGLRVCAVPMTNSSRRKPQAIFGELNFIWRQISSQPQGALIIRTNLQQRKSLLLLLLLLVRPHILWPPPEPSGRGAVVR